MVMGMRNERECVILVLAALLAGRALGFRTKSWVVPQREHSRVVVGIRGGGDNAAESRAEGLGGLGVGRGSSYPPANALLEPRPVGATEAVTVAKDPSDRALILDVDGTLYGQSSGVEQQIVDGIHRYFGKELGLSPAECNDIHHRHGSTVWGLQQEGRLSEDQVARYYEEVFSSVSVRDLDTGGSDGGDSGGGDATGYQHRANAAQMIRGHRGPVFVASNSPLSHVRRVLDGVGLGNASFAGVLTPDTRGWLTKSSPEFYDPILEHDSVGGAGVGPGDLWLLDDSAANLEVASRLGFRTLLVDGDARTGAVAREGGLPLERALACFVGAIPHPDEWQFSDSKYLRSKNAVDAIARSKEVWKRLETEVLALGLGDQDTLRVADIGCGLMPLLEDFRSLAKACGVQKVEYCGLEKEEGVAQEACRGLLGEGYALNDGSPGGSGSPAWRLTARRDGDESDLPETQVHIIAADFTSVDPASLFLFPGRSLDEDGDVEADGGGETAAAFSEHDIVTAGAVKPRRRRRRRRLPHVLVGCCLADLLAPASLMRALERLAGGGGGGGGGGDGGCLVYLPITFVGKTRMLPSAPQEGLLPSDETVLGAYDACLRDQQGHHTCLETLLQTIREHGADVITSAPSPWRVPFGGGGGGGGGDGYMWQCLLYFIGLGLAPHPLHVEIPTALDHAETSDSGGSSVTSSTEACEAGGALQQQQLQADFPGWVRRARERKPTLEADNVDLLFSLRGGGAGGAAAAAAAAGERCRNGGGGGCSDEDAHAAARRRRPRARQSTSAVPSSFPRGGGIGGGGQGVPSPVVGEGGAPPPPGVRDNAFLEFVAPGKVEVRHEELDEGRSVGEGQILVEAVCSSISSGTELKVFRGDFDSDSELDTTIKGMAGESMSYPLRYGYSLVGRVAKCGAGVNPEKFLGKLVFSFSPHSSWVVADADGVMLVPEGIDPEDAVYFPAVETALSLVHDVHPRVGESVAVFGQGMIGLLAVAVLAKTHGGVGGGKVVAVDMLPDRLAVAERLGATAAVTPGDAAGLAPFDTSLEVTGNPRGLQSALDLTGYGGRVVLGSWYGGGAAQLNLGMAFHRSHLTIQTSQARFHAHGVSRLPAGLTDRWDKERRFSAAWALVRELRPSSFLTTSSPGLDGAQGAYESLGAGSELGVVFRYRRMNE
ncbi:unnamed protein product [Pylaiella littoralis]